MKIASIYFDDIIVIPQGIQLGPTQPFTTLREQSFHAAEGWDIRETLPGTFSMLREGMSGPVTVGGYGYSYVREAEPEKPVTFVEATLPTKGRKR